VSTLAFSHLPAVRRACEKLRATIVRHAPDHEILEARGELLAALGNPTLVSFPIGDDVPVDVAELLQDQVPFVQQGGFLSAVRADPDGTNIALRKVVEKLGKAELMTTFTPSAPIHRTGPMPANPPPEERLERALALKPIFAATSDLVDKARYWFPEDEEISRNHNGWGCVWNAARTLDKLLFPLGRRSFHIACIELLGPNWVEIANALEAVMQRFDEFLNSLDWLDYYVGKSNDVPEASIRLEPNVGRRLGAAAEYLEKTLTRMVEISRSQPTSAETRTVEYATPVGHIIPPCPGCGFPPPNVDGACSNCGRYGIHYEIIRHRPSGGGEDRLQKIGGNWLPLREQRLRTAVHKASVHPFADGKINQKAVEGYFELGRVLQDDGWTDALNHLAEIWAKEILRDTREQCGQMSLFRIAVTGASKEIIAKELERFWERNSTIGWLEWHFGDELIRAEYAITTTQPSHSDDFTSVNWFGTEYSFGKGLQAESVRALWAAWENKTPSLSEKTIGEKAGSANDRFRLEHVFRPTNKGTGRRETHPAWGTMIKSVGKGVFALSPP